MKLHKQINHLKIEHLKKTKQNTTSVNITILARILLFYWEKVAKIDILKNNKTFEKNYAKNKKGCIITNKLNLVIHKNEMRTKILCSTVCILTKWNNQSKLNKLRNELLWIKIFINKQFTYNLLPGKKE